LSAEPKEDAMSFYSDTQTPSHVAWAVNSLAGIVVEPVRAVLQTLKNRRDAIVLAGMDEHMLADIGLTRGDVRDAFSEPVWRDPTAILVSRAHERRINRRRFNKGLVEKSFEAPSIVPSAKSAGLPAAWRAY
jgi:uncharacterized protein YjiS (DUF1127 family)